MKAMFVVIVCVSAFAWAGTKPDSADYTTNVHVSGSRLTTRSNDSFPRVQTLDATINGKKFELESDVPVNSLLDLGDYKARLIRDEHPNAYDSRQVYEILFPDQKTGRFWVVGQME